MGAEERTSASLPGGEEAQVKLEFLDATSLCDHQRLLRDLDHEKQMAVRNARIFPWQ